MPPKFAKKLTASQTQRAISNTQAEPVQASQEQATQPDAETQVDGDAQPDADDPSSSAHSNVADATMASTADGAAASGADTAASSADEVETKVSSKKKPAGKKVPANGGKAGDGSKRKRKRKHDPTNFQAYIHKIQKQVHPDCAMTKTAMQIMGDFIKDLCLRIADLASDLCKKLKKATLQAHDIQTATKLILSGELAKHALSEGGKALRTFNKRTEQGLR
ncbi:unnamed protein product [Aureobasidium uvarum]|uniref:Histone H2B n=1 Tax=Aureobasidium uvarum TaxID=2773716 RepID=A0A9N8PNW4_9PEZI|nr:unnamed protein product [Aureobasidium uvarum]